MALEPLTVEALERLASKADKLVPFLFDVLTMAGYDTFKLNIHTHAGMHFVVASESSEGLDKHENRPLLRPCFAAYYAVSRMVEGKHVCL